MTSEQENKTLLGNSISLPEMDEEEHDQESVLHDYWFLTIYNCIGKFDFKQNYLVVKNDILDSCSTEDQSLFCYKLLDRITEVYGWEFPENLEINTIESIKEFYSFLEFLEYDHEKFLCDVWVFLDPDLTNTTIDDFCKESIKSIISEIEEQIDANSFNELITIFLRTYNKEGILEWFSIMSNKIRSSILIRILEAR